MRITRPPTRKQEISPRVIMLRIWLSLTLRALATSFTLQSAAVMSLKCAAISGRVRCMESLKMELARMSSGRCCPCMGTAHPLHPE